MRQMLAIAAAAAMIGMGASLGRAGGEVIHPVESAGLRLFKRDKRRLARIKLERELRTREHVQAPETRQQRRNRERREHKNDRPRGYQKGERR